MKKNIRRGVLISLMLAILLAGGISCFTWHVGKMFVGLVSAEASNADTRAEDTQSSILILPEVKLWICQIGVYQERIHADKTLQLLTAQGYQAVIISESPYTVAVGAFVSKEGAGITSSALAKSTVQNWVREEDYPALHYKISGKDITPASLILNTANTVLTKSKEEMDANRLRKDIQSVSDETCPSDFQKLKNSLEMLLDTGSDIYDQQLLQVYAEYKTVTAKYYN